MGDVQLLKEMGERICQRRKAIGLTQEELAEKMGVSIQMISNLELGKKAIRPENLIKISQILGISTDYVLLGAKPKDDMDILMQTVRQLPEKKLRLVKEIVALCAENKKADI